MPSIALAFLLHYRHSYHAGNFADVFKHTLLCGLLQALNRKDKPWCYLETHAGAGLYDLQGIGAEKTGEWREGIARILARREALPEPLATFVQIARGANAEGSTHFYPGSPRFAQALARRDDRLALCESVGEVADELKAVFRLPSAGTVKPACAIHQRDGYEAHALLPPPEKRGLVLIDPPFERPDEFEAIGDFLVKALARFSNGVYAVWYPAKKRFDGEKFLRRMNRELTRPTLNIALDNGAVAEGQMRGCGLLIVNPPFRFAEDMEPALRSISRMLAQGPKATFRCEWIREEA